MQIPPRSFGFSKDVSAITRKPSFSETLVAALRFNDPVEPGVKRGGGFLLKRATTGAWLRRFFVVHSHYLSYFDKDPSPASDALKLVPLGCLDLWHVESVSLDDATLTLTLSSHAAGARRDDMGAKALRETKRMIRSMHLPGSGAAKAVVRQLEVARRGSESSQMQLKAASPMEAQLWLRAMRESPLMGSLATSDAAPNSDEASNADAMQRRVIKEIRFLLPPKRQVAYHDAFQDSEILLRRVPAKGAKVEALVASGKLSYTGSLPFEPPAHQASGSLTMSLAPHTEDVVVLDWKRVDVSHQWLAASAAGAGLAACAASWLATRNVPMSMAAGTLALLAAAAGLKALQQQRNDICLTRVYVNVASSISSPRASKAAGKAAAGTSPRMGAAAKAPAASADANITAQEAALLVGLRERLADLYDTPANLEQILKRHGKFLAQWGADLGNLADKGKRKVVIDKHVGADFRAVRFLRARNMNLDKAELMARECLTWRIAMSSDALLDSFEPPQWLLDYAGSPVFNLLRRPEADAQARFDKFWVRDRKGHLSIVFRQGRLSSRRIFRKLHSNPAYLIKCLVWAAEIGRHDLDRMHMQTKGKVESVVTAIVDLEGFAISNQIPLSDLVGLARQFFPIFSTSFPELLNRVIVVRAPWLFETVWTAISPFIPAEVLSKIHIHSGEVDMDKHITPYIHPDAVPAYLGGNLVEEDGDDMCAQRFPALGPFLPDNGESLLAGLEPAAEMAKTKKAGV